MLPVVVIGTRGVVRIVVLAAAVTAVMPLAAAAGARGVVAAPAPAPGTGRALSGALADRTPTPAAARTLAVRAATALWGGSFTASTGEPVVVQVSDAYPQDPALPQRWADYLASLVHGPELGTLTAYIAPVAEVESLCGEEALACYSPALQTLVVPGEDPSSDISTEAIVAHEYGHHVAANRPNPPWAGVDYGPKRWASYVDVCARARSGELSPGAEDERRYAFNPGEGFAEAYRVLNQRRLGQPLLAWQIVSTAFVPDPTALQLLERDVRTPWVGPTTRRLAGGLAARRVRTVAVATPLDGTARITLRVSRGAVTADVLAGTRRLRMTASAGRAQGRSLTVCGERTLRVRTAAGRRAARYTVTVVRP